MVIHAIKIGSALFHENSIFVVLPTQSTGRLEMDGTAFSSQQLNNHRCNGQIHIPNEKKSM